jgi:Na+/H+ antiporter NhaC
MYKSILLILTLFFSVGDVFSQCAMCKAVAEDAAEESAANINGGIIYIMLIPYIILVIAFRKKIYSGLRQLKRVPETTGRKKAE